MTLLTNSIETPVTLQSEVNRVSTDVTRRIQARVLGGMEDAETVPMVHSVPVNRPMHSTSCFICFALSSLTRYIEQ